MAFSLSDPHVQVALPAPLPGRLAHHQRLRLCDPQLYGRTATAIPEQGVYPLPARLIRGGGVHAVARDQGRQAASAGRRSLIVAGRLGCWAPQSLRFFPLKLPLTTRSRLRYITPVK